MIDNMPKPPEKDEINISGISKNDIAVDGSTPIEQEQKNPPKNKSILIIIILFSVVAFIGLALFFTYSNKNAQQKVEGGGFFSQKEGVIGDEQPDDAFVESDSVCRQRYKDLLLGNSFDFDTYCINQNVRTGNYDANKVPQKKKNLVLIFDASGSMAAQIGGKRKIDIAKEAAWKFIDQIANEENLALSIIVYGHKGSNSVSQKKMSCEGIEEIYYLGNVDSEIAKSKLNKFDATGWTPIAGSFQKANEILKTKPNDENFILLVSDGKEMCDGDPVAKITQLKNEGLNVSVDVIGFDVGGVDEEQLKNIAKAGEGDYFSVSSAVDLENAFAKHKEMLNKVTFEIGRTLEQVSDVSFIINNYNQCLMMLKKEEAVMMLDIHAKKLIGTECEAIAQKQQDDRVNTIKQKLDQIYKEDIEVFNTIK